jgi:hypothetical protein
MDISSALILEDDIDWDIKIHDQIKSFGQAMHALTHPSQSGGHHFDPTYPFPHPGDVSSPIQIPVESKVTQSKTSIYGDAWDLLWIGHCAASIPPNGTLAASLNHQFHRGLVVYPDNTVPESQYLAYNGGHRLVNEHPPHSRAVHHSLDNVCTFGIAVTQRMARRLLFHFSIDGMDKPIDLEYKSFCEGVYTKGDGEVPACYTVQPPLFSKFRRRGHKSGDSDISTGEQGVRKEDYSPNVRYSVMRNLRNLVYGKQAEDVAPDGGQPPE